MSQLRVTYEDQEYEFVGYQHETGTFALAGAGFGILVECSDEPTTEQSSHAHFRKVPVRHTFGEKRSTTFGDCFLDNNSIPHLEIWYQSHNSLTPYTILRPVEVTND